MRLNTISGIVASSRVVRMWLLFLVVLVVALARASEQLPTAGRTTVKVPPNKLGVHLLFDDGRQQWPQEVWSTHMRLARQTVGAWGHVTELVRLDDQDVERWQLFMDLCAMYQLKPVLRLVTTFDTGAGRWRAPRVDPDGTYRHVAAQYANFVAALRWPVNQHYVIVGNEPNRGDEWGGRPEPAAYARFLSDVATAIKARDPQAVILNAGLDLFAPNSGSRPAFDGRYYMDAGSFLDQMYMAVPEVFNKIDLWASHSYPMGPFTEGPWQQAYVIDLLNDASNPRHVEPPSNVFNRGINGYRWELWKLASYGVRGMKVMITETGWRHAESTEPAATDTSERMPDAATTAAFLELALYGNHGRHPAMPRLGWTPWLSDTRIIAVTAFAFNGYPEEWGHTNWLALDRQGKVLATYAPIDVLMARNARP